MASRTLLSALVGAATVSAHGFVTNVVINGDSYQGYDVTKFPYQQDPPVVVGWATSAKDTGFVAPDAYGSPDIICHRDGANAGGHASVAAGDSIFLQWTEWPESHHGPVLDYLAACGDAGCETVDKTTLKFFKIDEVGLVDSSQSPGVYGADELIANSNGWMVEIPADVKPGFYVLRHEIIALHSANNAGGAQNYPQCFNLEITGSGTAEPEGTLGTELYSPDDAGILFNLYNNPTSYQIPGPALIEGASAVSQVTSAIASTATPTTGTDLSDTPGNGNGGDNGSGNGNGNGNGATSTPSPIISTPASGANSTIARPTATSQAPGGGNDNGNGNGNGNDGPTKTATTVLGTKPATTASGFKTATTASATRPATGDASAAPTGDAGCNAKKHYRRNKRSKRARRHA